jgi:hypothetical protein
MAKRWRGLAPIGLLIFVSFAGCENDEATCPKDDGNPCTADLCEGGATVYEPLAAGSVCYTGAMSGVCEGGACVVPCESAKDCDDKNPCTADDCALPYKTCVHVADSSIQPPDDGNPCTWEGCSGGKAHYVPASNNTPCGQGVCEGGVCSKCSTDADCGKDTPCADWVCVNSACEAKYEPPGAQVFLGDSVGDCRRLACGEYGSIVQVLYQQDPPMDDNNPCTDELCRGWTPVHQVLDQGTFCPGGVCRGDGVCVECTKDLHCGKAYCYQNECHSCENGVLDGDETGIDCGGSACGGCLGDPCLQGTDCASQNCADGVCCNLPCGTCSTCNAAGSVGQCKAVPKYDDDPPSCSLNPGGKMCNGLGSCKTALGFPCAGNFECASSKCVNGLCAGP